MTLWMRGAFLFNIYIWVVGTPLPENQDGLQEWVPFKRGAAEKYTCADEPAAEGYRWYTRGGRPIEDLSDWQALYLENGRQIMLRSPNNTSITELYLFCVRNDSARDVIHSLTIYRDPGNEKYRGFTETTCDIYDNRQPELICQGASEYRIYKCDWYLEGNPDPIASDHEPSLRLGTEAAPLVPGTYRCECEIGHGKHELRTFPVRAVGAGPVKESKFCRQWPIEGKTDVEFVTVNEATLHDTRNDGHYTKDLSQGHDTAEHQISSLKGELENSESKFTVVVVVICVSFSVVVSVLVVLLVKEKKKRSAQKTSPHSNNDKMLSRVSVSKREGTTLMDDETGES